MHIPSARAVSRVLITTLVLTLTSTGMASAKVFRCASEDVSCLIGSIRSANERGGPDTIILEAGNYTLTVIDNTEDRGREGEGNFLPSITSRLTIEGAGPTETIIESVIGSIGFGFGRILHIAPTGDLALHGVTIQGGFAEDGGGIFNRGTLTITQSVIRDNIVFFGFGGGILNLGTLRILDSRITGNGAAGFTGGIESRGSLEIWRSTIDHNSAESSGGIAASGTTRIEDSTISENLAFEGNGGGLGVGGTMTITNTTIAKNSAFRGSGGGLIISGTVRLTNSTVADNLTAPPLVAFPDARGGALDVRGGTVQLQNTILARNILLSIDGEPLPADCLGSITSLGNNIIGDTTDCAIDLASTDLVGDAGLGVFVDEGTPGRGYIPLLAESPAIDAANRAACPRRDQLGQRRVDGDGDHRKFCDIGAVEFIP
jgi:hypothetical protein